MKAVTVRITESAGRLKTEVISKHSDDATRLEIGVAQFVEQELQTMLNRMFDGAEALAGGVK